MSYNTQSMSKKLERVHYTLAYESGELVRRGKKRIGGKEVILYNNYSRLPRSTRGEIIAHMLVEVALATNSDPESVWQLLMKNYNAAIKRESDNSFQGDHSPVTVEPIRYTVDPRRKAFVNIYKAPILANNN